MGPRVRQLLRPWLPSRALELWHRRGHGSSLSLTDKLWAEYQGAKSGYHDETIFRSVQTATESVLRKGSGYERDGVEFDEPSIHWPVLGALFEARNARDGVLTVVDVGGSLASKWIQHRPFLNDLAPIRWVVVEQEHYVHAGRKLFDPSDVEFKLNLDGAIADVGSADFILFSSSLHYFEHPMEILDQACRSSSHSVVVDRTPIWNQPRPHLAVQKVALYSEPVEYPCWILSRAQVMDVLKDSFRLVSTWEEQMPIPSYPTNAGIEWLGVCGIGRRA